MIVEGRTIMSGKATGEVVKLGEPLSFLGGVDGSTGDLRVGGGGNVAGKVLVFPKGKGSTVGSFVMYDLMVHGVAPAAVINETAETIVATGAVISSIPMVDSVPSVDMFEDGDVVTVDATAGTVEIEGVEMKESVSEMKESVSSAVVMDGRVLMLKRPESSHSFPGVWSLVAGRVEPGESPEDAARREIREETAIEVGSPAASLGPVYVREGRILWKVHPFAFSVSGQGGTHPVEGAPVRVQRVRRRARPERGERGLPVGPSRGHPRSRDRQGHGARCGRASEAVLKNDSAGARGGSRPISFLTDRVSSPTMGPPTRCPSSPV